MLTLNIVGSEVNDKEWYTKPVICKTDGIFPKMYNGGWNDFHFNEGVNFTFENMPLIRKLYGDGMDRKPIELKNWIEYECHILVEDQSGHKQYGYYYKTFDKKAGVYVNESVDFS